MIYHFFLTPHMRWHNLASGLLYCSKPAFQVPYEVHTNNQSICWGNVKQSALILFNMPTHCTHHPSPAIKRDLYSPVKVTHIQRWRLWNEPQGATNKQRNDLIKATAHHQNSDHPNRWFLAEQPQLPVKLSSSMQALVTPSFWPD